jgi:hypothetical protein
MATDTPSAATGRPRPWLLIVLGLVVVAFLATQMFSGGTVPESVPSAAQPRPGQRAQGGSGPIDPKELDVKIEALKGPAQEQAEFERNPFRFQPKPPPAQPPSSFASPPKPVDPGPPPPPVVTGPPRISSTIKFIGIVETGKDKIGAFSYYDETSRTCKATFPGRAGEVLEGRYRVVSIGVESAVLEYVNGTGRETIPLNGQACVTR